MFPADEDLTSPERWPAIAGYEILGVLGQGGMGVVYRARQSDLGREVALKMIAAGERSSAVDVGRLLNDASTAAQLRHDHIVPVYTVGQYRGLPYCVMELITGGSLAQRVADLVGQPREAARLVAAASRALHHAHLHGVCHRDVKPANILLRVRCMPLSARELGTNGIPVPGRPPLCEVDACVADFGLAKRTREETGLTVDGAIVGTPGYMAPEQIRSEKPTPAADVYGLGAVLYECLTGQPPSRGATRFDTLLLTLNEEPERPRRLNSHLPRDLETICLKCLEKQPARRYASAQALEEDLQRFIDGRPIHARPVGPLERGWRWCRRKPVRASLLAVLFVMVLVCLVMWRRAVVQEQEAEGHYAMLRQLLGNKAHLSPLWVLETYDPDPLPETMLTDAEACLSHLLPRRPDDLELRVLLANVLTHLSRRRNPAEAAALLERATRLWEQIPLERLREPRDLASRASTYVYLGASYGQQGRLDLALQAFTASFHQFKALAEEHPDPSYRNLLFYASLDVGFSLIRTDHSEEEVVRWFDELRTRPELLDGQDAYEMLLALLRVRSLCTVAEKQYQAKDEAAGLAATRNAALILENFCRRSADESSPHTFAGDYSAVCSQLRKGRMPAEALRLAEQWNQSSQKRTREMREKPKAWEDLSQSWLQIAKARWLLDQREETLDAYRQALAAQRQVCVLAPTVVYTRAALGLIHLQLGRKLCELGRLDEAEACFRERQALWPGDTAKHEEALRELRKWARQVEEEYDDLTPEQRLYQQRYLDLCARLERKGSGAAPASGREKP
jgi:tetratricopeptide (TPR) repeat protein